MTVDVSTFLNYRREDSHTAIDIHTHEGWMVPTNDEKVATGNY